MNIPFEKPSYSNLMYSMARTNSYSRLGAWHEVYYDRKLYPELFVHDETKHTAYLLNIMDGFTDPKIATKIMARAEAASPTVVFERSKRWNLLNQELNLARKRNGIIPGLGVVAVGATHHADMRYV